MALEKKRFVLLVDMDIYEKFKELAKEQNRTAGNLGTKLIQDYVKNNSKFKSALCFSLKKEALTIQCKKRVFAQIKLQLGFYIFLAMLKII